MPKNLKAKYSRAAEVKARYGGVSDMWLHRRLRDDNFPQPIFFGSKERFFENKALDEWDALMIERGCKSSSKLVPPPKAVQS
jgi:predicted DNA-binding transcriptional regulator AlpA